MSNLLVVVHNGEIKIEYNRSEPLAGLQRRFLNQMDADMSTGITIDGQKIANPNKSQRVQFVTNYLVNSFLANKKQMVVSGCAYLAKALPDLKQIRIDTNTTTSEDRIDLIFDEEL